MTDFDRELTFDFKRDERLGFSEAIFCLQKSPRQIDAILRHGDQEDRSLLLTRLLPSVWEELSPTWGERVDYDEVSSTGWLDFKERSISAGDIAIVTAGTSDVPVAKEATRTLRFYGHEASEIYDVGVAGLWRLLDRLDEIKQHKIIIAVAGMDAALPSVLGGLVSGLVIAVPTSTGYGVAENGMTAVKSALSSCAPGVLVCNIDNGYGAACAALRIYNSWA